MPDGCFAMGFGRGQRSMISVCGTEMYDGYICSCLLGLRVRVFVLPVLGVIRTLRVRTRKSLNSFHEKKTTLFPRSGAAPDPVRTCHFALAWELLLVLAGIDVFDHDQGVQIRITMHLPANRGT